MVRILAIADEVDESLYGDEIKRKQVEAVISCGDLPFEYLEYIVTMLGVPLVYVPGNHDPEIRAVSDEVTAPSYVRSYRDLPGPQGCMNADGRVVDAAGMRIAGLGGSLRYSTGPNQYTQSQMRRRALRLEAAIRWRRIRGAGRMDVIVTHAPPLGAGDDPGDPAHQGFAAFHRLIRKTSPAVMVHGHVHHHEGGRPDLCLGDTAVLNAVGHRTIEVPP